MDAILNKEIIVNKSACRFIGALVFIIFTALGAFVRIPLPFTPVPITLQTFFVLLGGCFLGKKLGVLTQLTYVLLGVLGMPLFTASNFGLAYLFGATGGYLFGFILASFFVGSFIVHENHAFWRTFFVLLAADCLILLSGTIWLKSLLGISMPKAFFIGFLPFIVGDLLKVFAATAIYLRFQPRIKKVF